MEWPGPDYVQPMPMYVNGSLPHRHRGRTNVAHPQAQPYTCHYQGPDGTLLVPAAGPAYTHHRSHSAAAPMRQPAVVINNTHWEDVSPNRGSRHRQSSRSHDNHCSSSDDYESRSPHGRRSRSHRHHSRSHSRSPDPAPLVKVDPQAYLKLKKYEEKEAEEERRRRHEWEAAEDKRKHDQKRREEKLKELEKKEEEEAVRQRIEEENILKEARRAKKLEQEEELRKLVIDEFKAEELKKHAQDEREKKEEDEKFRKVMTDKLLKQGYSKESIESMLNGEEKRREKHGKDKKKIKDSEENTWAKVSRQHLSAQTLLEYGLPWEFFDGDPNYIIVKKRMTRDEWDDLFDHTTRHREKKKLLITDGGERKAIKDGGIRLEKENGQLRMVRSSSKARSKSRRRSFAIA